MRAWPSQPAVDGEGGEESGGAEGGGVEGSAAEGGGCAAARAAEGGRRFKVESCSSADHGRLRTKDARIRADQGRTAAAVVSGSRGGRGRESSDRNFWDKFCNHKRF